MAGLLANEAVGSPFGVAALPPKARRLLELARHEPGLRADALRIASAPAPVVSIAGIVGSTKHHLVDALMSGTVDRDVLRVHLGPRHTTLASLGELLLRSAAEREWIADLTVRRTLQRTGDSHFADFYSSFDQVLADGRRLTVVIDDMQWLGDDETTEVFLTGLVRWPELRLVCTSIDDARLLDACHAAGVTAVALDERLLFYSEAETRRLLDLGGLVDVFDRTWRMAGGYPLATVLFADLFSSNPTISDAAAAEWVGALIAQVMRGTLPDLGASTPPVGAEFPWLLMQASRTPVFTRGMLTDLAPDRDMHRHIDRLLAGPLVATGNDLLDGEPLHRWSHGHRLTLASINRQRYWTPLSGEQCRSLSRRLLAAGLTGDALDLALSASDAELLDRLCRERLLEIARSQTLLTRLRALVVSPHEVVESMPHAALLHVFGGVVSGGLDADAASLGLLRALAAPGGIHALAATPDALALLRITEFAAATLAGDHAAIERMRRALAAPVAEGADTSEQMSLWLEALRGMAALFVGDLEQMHEIFAAVDRRSRHTRNPQTTRLCAAALHLYDEVADTPAVLRVHTGTQVPSPDDALVTSERLIDSLRTIAQAWAALNRADPQEALRLLSEDDWAQVPGPISAGYAIAGAQALLALGRTGEAGALARRTRTRLAEQSPAWLPHRLLMVEVIAAVADTDLERARHLLGLLPDQPAEAGAIARSIVALAAGDAGSARSVPGELAGLLAQPLIQRTRDGALVLLALATCRNGDAPGARARLVALHTPPHGGAPWLLLALASRSDLDALARVAAADDDAHTGPLLSWIDRARHAPLHVLPEARPTVHLTPRERQVLAQLHTGASYAQIAQALFVSHNTVKSQVRAVYAKLEVDNRGDAIEQALRLQLL